VSTIASTDATIASVRRSLEGSRRSNVAGTLFTASLLACLLISLLFLIVLIGTVLAEGLGVLGDRGLDFLTTGTSGSAATAGVWQAIKGSFYIAVIVVLLAFPIGIGASVYLEEYARETRLTRFININIRNLAGVPSIVYGILGLAIFVKAMGGLTGGRSAISGGVTLAILVLPIVIITASEALRAVPQSIREAGYGVGASQWEVTRSHVLPYAAPGILTGTVLSLARALGEAAPLILVGAVTGFFATSSDAGIAQEVQGPFTALPNIAFNWARQPGSGWPENTAAAIIVMLVVILSANAFAILLRNRYDKKRDA
jgi:phosphate transport system permease protein